MMPIDNKKDPDRKLCQYLVRKTPPTGSVTCSWSMLIFWKEIKYALSNYTQKKNYKLPLHFKQWRFDIYIFFLHTVTAMLTFWIQILWLLCMCFNVALCNHGNDYFDSYDLFVDLINKNLKKKIIIISKASISDWKLCSYIRNLHIIIEEKSKEIKEQ